MTSMPEPTPPSKPRIGRPPHGPPCPTCGARYHDRMRASSAKRRQLVTRIKNAGLYCPACTAPPCRQKQQPWLAARRFAPAGHYDD